MCVCAYVCVQVHACVCACVHIFKLLDLWMGVANSWLVFQLICQASLSYLISQLESSFDRQNKCLLHAGPSDHQISDKI